MSPSSPGRSTATRGRRTSGCASRTSRLPARTRRRATCACARACARASSSARWQPSSTPTSPSPSRPCALGSRGRRRRTASCTVFSCAPIISQFMRLRIREKYEIKGSTAQDMAFHYCCFPCALTQEYEELRKRVPVPPGYKWKKIALLADDEPGQGGAAF
mmetsp:Transcript_12609/g.43788  ORF Transcript_12609/g.43788 Transcript_12609/m.43788 type:complete len:161 (-) Transcript_12609:1051-1533(-)